MTTKKEQLIEEAKELGISTFGTILDLTRRITREKELIARKKKVEPEPVPEPKPEPKPEPVIEDKSSVAVAKKGDSKLPRAVSAEGIEDEGYATALVTCTKFVGGWRNLKKGEKIVAPIEVIRNLRQLGLVK